jgi:hypothetical protein
LALLYEVRYNVPTNKEGVRTLKTSKQPGSRVDTSLLQAALIGYEQMNRDVDEKIASIRNRLGSGRTAGAPASRRPMGANARKRIAAAQKKRWALAKARQVEPKSAKPELVQPKRTMSAAGRRRIAAAQKKRWAVLKAKTAA